MRKLMALSFVVFAAGGTDVATYTAQAENMKVECPGIARGIVFYRGAAMQWQHKLGIMKFRAERTHFNSCAYGTWVAHRWMHRAAKLRRNFISYARRQAHARRIVRSAGHTSLWMCIHAGEGAWNSQTGNGYYGGLQMLPGWGGVSNAALLSPAEQMALAERGYRASGYSTAWLLSQWPHTAPPCLGYR